MADVIQFKPTAQTVGPRCSVLGCENRPTHFVQLVNIDNPREPAGTKAFCDEHDQQ